MTTPAAPDRWSSLRAATPARIGLPRAGQALAVSEVLALQLAHARARDAVHASLDHDRLRRDLGAAGEAALSIASAATSRDLYLRRPDLGRVLDQPSAYMLETLRRAEGFDLAIVVADGLSAVAAQANAPALALAIAEGWTGRGLSLAPLVVASQARVALGDDIAARLGARAVLVLIGERPGLSAADSLGAYLTHAPRLGLSSDADRNCVSNIRDGGLSCEQAAGRLLWLLAEARRRGQSGVALKDESALALLTASEGF